MENGWFVTRKDKLKKAHDFWVNRKFLIMK